jgi:hypothetical protein
MRRTVLLFLATFVLGGCYHATVNTGVTPGSTQINQPWATSFVYGLVPPATVEAMQECGSAGVARVETQHSFLNALVGGLTFGIFTPMTITVTCGAGEDEDLPEPQTREEVEQALSKGVPFLVPIID